MRRTSIIAAACALIAPAAVTTNGHAFTGASAGGLQNFDARDDESAAVPASRRAGRKALERELGQLGDVRTDAASGGVAYVGRTDALLTGPSKRSPESIVLEYVRVQGGAFGLDKQDVANLRLVARSVSPDGITHLRYNQVLDGILAFDSGVTGHVTRDGRLINVSGAPVAGARLAGTDPQVTATAALGEARRSARGSAVPPRVDEAGRTTRFATGELAALRWSATADGPRLAWNVVADGAGDESYSVLVDATSGDVLLRSGLTDHLGQANYFAVDPDVTPAQTQITMPPSWYDEHNGGTRLWGNLSRTYVDPNDQDPPPGTEEGGTRVQIPASAGAPASPDWLYTQTKDPSGTPCPSSGCTWNSADSSTRDDNQFQAAANVHVQVGRFHDHLAAAPIGFDEASGNFQRVNATGAGAGGDYVRSEVNDGQGVNNANFSTPPDGQAPRMQMFLFTVRDANGSDVADIVFHEYTHGLSNRLVVNASGASTLNARQGSMMGEGWSDFYATDFLLQQGLISDTPTPAELRLGKYVVGPNGIRIKPMDCPVSAVPVPGCEDDFGAEVIGGYTYGDLAVMDPAFPHNGGELWSQILLEIRGAAGAQDALALITGGMRLSASNPSMLDMRDAILQQAVAMRSAVGAPNDHYVTLWEVFRKRGMGASATTPNSDSSTPTEAFDAPSGLRTGGPAVLADPYPGGDNDGEIEAGEQFRVSQPITGVGLIDLPGVTGTLSSGGADVAVETGSAAWPVLGRARTASNEPFVARVAAGSCTAPTQLTIDVSSTEGNAQTTARVDPRPASSTVVPLADAANPATPGVTEATFVARGSGNVTDVDVRIDDLRHTFLGDLKVEVVHDGVTAILFQRLGSPMGSYSGNDIIDARFDSDAGATLPNTGPGPITGHMRTQPGNSLDAFDTHPAAGVWTLRITDVGAMDTGELRRWGLDSAELLCGRLEIPAAATGAASAIGQTAATLAGSVTPNGRATGLRFVYGTTTAYGSQTPTEDVGAGDDAAARTATLSGLEPSTVYHYRVEAIREGGQTAVVGEDRTFSTEAAPTPTPSASPSSTVGPGVVPTPTPGPIGADRVAPKFTGRTTVKLAKVRRTSRRRATFAFTLDEPARVTATVTRSAPGIRRGKRCVAVPRRRPRGARSCTRQVAAATATTTLTKIGPGTLRLAAKGLGKGRYTATLVAVDAAGNRSRPAVVRFRVR